MVKRSRFRKIVNYVIKRAKRMKAKEQNQKQRNQPLLGIKTQHFCTRGFLHIKSSLPCQDNADSLQETNYCLAVVADGHGSSQYFRSDRGSKIAVKMFEQCVKNALIASTSYYHRDGTVRDNTSSSLIDALAKPKLSRKKQEQIIQWFCQSILVNWRECVQQDMKTSPYTESEIQQIPEKYRNAVQQYISAYGSTLIAALTVAEFCLLIQIGDGVCVVFDDDTPKASLGIEARHKYEYGKLVSYEPIPLDEQCFLNTTTSLCDSKANEEFHFCLLKKLPIAVILSSDGIEDCFHDREDLHKFFHRILSDFSNSEDENHSEEELNSFLPKLSEKGSGDDLSLSMIYNAERFKALTQNT